MEISNNNGVSRSWFVVLNNPENHGYIGTPQDIIERLKQEWIKDNPLRCGWWAYCISAEGTHHVHIVLEDTVPCRFSKIKKAYPSAHIEATRGRKDQVEAYIKKEPPFEEKGERILASCTAGEIKGCSNQKEGKSKQVIYDIIQESIEDGMTPTQIMEMDIRFRKEKELIKSAYFAKRCKETPLVRDVIVYWHIGLAGTGKTNSYLELAEKFGADQVYLCTDYSNKGSAMFDFYCGEKVIFLDELKLHSLPYQVLLNLLDK